MKIKAKISVFLMALLLWVALLNLPIYAANELSYSAANIKAAYTLKIKEFVRWPEDSKVSKICVVGSDVIGSLLAQIQVSLNNGHTVKIEKKLGSSSFNDCQIVYISKFVEESREQVLFATKNMPILTISDIENFIYKGGMIEFSEVKHKIRISVNMSNAKTRELIISSKLLQIADKVVK